MELLIMLLVVAGIVINIASNIACFFFGVFWGSKEILQANAEVQRKKEAAAKAKSSEPQRPLQTRFL
tara:strand:+ start:436 stop:636 length:201 start_codon:yes stop_codon:yes gene_type:complete